jgi:alpha-beta hydrolase superfamily lysophospholipase
MPVAREAFRFGGRSGAQIAGYRWVPPKPKAVVQLAHGMGEHALRYDRLAGFLTSAGYAVYANDHRGHGATAAGPDALGDFGPDGFDAVVDDLGYFAAHIREEQQGARLVLLGHSMGSMAAQYFVLDRSTEIDGLILSGSTAMDLFAAAMADPSAVKLDNAFNAAFEPARTPFDWLSRDEAEVDAYIADPLCGFTVTPASMASMFAQAVRSGSPEALAVISQDLPVLVLAGDADPLNARLDLLRVLTERYRAAGLSDVTTAFYEGGRHEMFNETNRAQVFADLLAWLEQRFA